MEVFRMLDTNVFEHMKSGAVGQKHCQKQGFMQKASSSILFIEYFSALFFYFYMKQTVSFHDFLNALPFPSSTHQHTQRLHFTEVQRVFIPQHLYLPQASPSSGRRTAEVHCEALNTLSIALVSQEPAFHVSDFSQGVLMLIHFTLLTHLFFGVSFLF